MAKLNQIIALEKGIKSESYAKITEINKAIQRADAFNGFSKVYQKTDADGEDLPSESKKVQLTARHVLQAVRHWSARLIDITARKDYTNQTAIADLKVDGNTIIPAVPVTHLLFLEKQLKDLYTLVQNMPVLDSADEWEFDENAALHKTDAIPTHRTKKVQKPIVLYAATDKHPAQTQLITEDVLAGHWMTTKMSGAMTLPEKEELLKRIGRVYEGTKTAREDANIAVEDPTMPNVSKALFEYVFGDKI